jgi:hypothetical protein
VSPWRSFAVLLLICGCAVDRAPPAASPAGVTPRSETLDETASFVSATIALARSGSFDDPARVEELLGLPGMTAALEWTVPPSWDQLSGSSASFWLGEESPLRNVFLQRGVAHGDGGRRNWLHVIFKEGRCPTIEAVEGAMGIRFHVVSMPPSAHGGQFYDARFVSVRAADGRAVDVSIEPDGCGIRLAAPASP